MPDKTVSTANPKTVNTFVSVTGSSLRCDRHGIDTFDLNEWNDHCSDPNNGHIEAGSVKCMDCPNLVSVDGHPHVPITAKGKVFELRCDECLDKYVNANKALNLNKNKGVSPK